MPEKQDEFEPTESDPEPGPTWTPEDDAKWFRQHYVIERRAQALAIMDFRTARSRLATAIESIARMASVYDLVAADVGHLDLLKKVLKQLDKVDHADPKYKKRMKRAEKA